MPADVNDGITKGIGLGAATFGSRNAAPASAAASAGLAIGVFFYVSEFYAVASAGIGLSSRVASVDSELANGRYRR